MKTLALFVALAAAPAEKDVFACNLRGLTEAERVRHHELSKKLLGAVTEKRELDDGYAFKLSGDALLEGAEWVKYEHKCCPFFTLTLEQARDDDGPLWLKVTGREGVKAFIRREFRLQ
jgi:hypothetical protein